MDNRSCRSDQVKQQLACSACVVVAMVGYCTVRGYEAGVGERCRICLSHRDSEDGYRGTVIHVTVTGTITVNFDGSLPSLHCRCPSTQHMWTRSSSWTLWRIHSHPRLIVSWQRKPEEKDNAPNCFRNDGTGSALPCGQMLLLHVVYSTLKRMPLYRQGITAENLFLWSKTETIVVHSTGVAAHSGAKSAGFDGPLIADEKHTVLYPNYR
jgi:hypothetical protein